MTETQIPGHQVLDGTITDSDVSSSNKDGLASVPSMRTLGTNSTQASPGDDPRFSDILTWNINGKVDDDVFQDGFRSVIRSGSIVGVTITAGRRGSSSSTIFDINKFVPAKPITTQRNNITGSTIYTNQSNRPTVQAGVDTENAIIEAPLPDITSFTAGDFFSVDVDQKAQGQAKDFSIQMFVKYT